MESPGEERFSTDSSIRTKESITQAHYLSNCQNAHVQVLPSIYITREVKSVDNINNTILGSEEISQ